LYCVASFSAYAQKNPKLDSLQKAYHVAQHDSIKILHLTAIALEYRNSHVDTTISIAQSTLIQSQQLNYQEGIAKSYLALGVAYQIKNNYSLSLDYSLKAAKLLEGLNLKTPLANSLMNIGLSYNNLSNYSLALENYQKALRLYESLNDKPSLGHLLNNIGLAYKNQGNYPAALEYYQKSLKVREELKNKQGIANLLNNIGTIHYYQHDYQQALDYYQRSLAIKEELKDRRGAAYTLNNLGEIYTVKGDLTLALEYYQKSLLIKEEMKEKPLIASGLNNIGDIYYKQKTYSLAIDCYQRSFKLYEELGEKKWRTYPLNGLANVYAQQKNYEKAIHYAEQALKLAEEIMAFKEINMLSLTLYDIYKKQGNYLKALELHELYRETKDSLFSVEKARSIANLEAKAEIENKEKEIQLLNKTTELLEKDKALQVVELERQKNAKIAIEKQAEADRLFALAQQEHDQRKQDSLRTLAQKNQLEAEKLKIENQHKELEAQKAQDTQRFYLIINYLGGSLLVLSLLFLWFSWRNRKKLQQANNDLTLANQAIEVQKTEILNTLTLVERQRNEIQTKNEDVIASIKYAKRIQTVLLPKVEKLQSYFPELLLFYQPKDIVSGDFYWYAKMPNDPSILLAVADCTGHGVPGAFMTVIGENLLDQIINKDKITSPAQILENLDERLSQILQHQDIANEAINDGMDISILHYDKECSLLVWAGAKRPLWVFEQGKEIPTEYKGNRFPVGSTQFKQKEFAETTIQLKQGDMIYAFTDGYADQFGKEGKFTIKKFRNLLQEIHHQNIATQLLHLQENFHDWKGQEEQTDDILVVGIRI